MYIKEIFSEPSIYLPYAHQWKKIIICEKLQLKQGGNIILEINIKSLILQMPTTDKREKTRRIPLYCVY